MKFIENTSAIQNHSINDWLIIIGLIGGFVVNAFLSEFYPILRHFLVALFFSLAILRLLFSKNNYSRIQLLLLLFVSTALSAFNTWYNGSIHVSLYLVPLVLVLMAKVRILYFVEVLKSLLIINLLVQIYEVFNGEYLISNPNVYFEIGRYQGVFSYSKETAYFLMFAYIFVRKSKHSLLFLFVSLFSAVLTGSRTAQLFVGLLGILDVSRLLFTQLKRKNILTGLFLISTLVALITALRWYFSIYINVYSRVLDSLNMDSSGHRDRLYFIKQYISSLENSSIRDVLLGNGTYINSLVGNGSETTYLDVIAQLGVQGLLVYFAIFIGFKVLNSHSLLTNFEFILILFFMLVGRVSLGWADGILMWVLISNKDHVKISNL